MDVSEFVRESILQIMTGVQEAQKVWNVDGNKGHINPIWRNIENPTANRRDVAFDIAVTVSDASTAGAKGGLKVVALGEIGGNTEAISKRESVSRLSFSVPILPPAIFVSED